MGLINNVDCLDYHPVVNAIRKSSRTLLLPILLVCLHSPASAVDPDASLRARQFVVMGYHGIVLDLERGSGAYLSTLADLLGVPDAEHGALAGEVQALVKAHPNIMDLADRVGDLQRTSRAVVPTALPVPSGPNVRSGTAIEPALRHATRGTPVTVFLHGGESMSGRFVEFQTRRLWLRGASRRSVLLRDIAAVEIPSSRD